MHFLKLSFAVKINVKNFLKNWMFFFKQLVMCILKESDKLQERFKEFKWLLQIVKLLVILEFFEVISVQIWNLPFPSDLSSLVSISSKIIKKHHGK